MTATPGAALKSSPPGSTILYPWSHRNTRMYARISTARCGLRILPAVGLLLLNACASPPPQRTPGPVPPAAAERAAERELLIRAARDAIGAPYRYGGNTPAGFDCSGLVQYAHGRLGIDVPRTTHAQWQAAMPPARPYLVPGDLLFFEIGRAKTRHVGIYEGGGLFIHAPSSGRPVGRASLDNPYWRTRLVGTRSFL